MQSNYANKGSEGVRLIDAERRRQIEGEGYDANHDSGHLHGAIAMAAATYAMPDQERIRIGRLRAPVTWPQGWSFKPSPKDRVRELVKAGALIAAEIDRLTADKGK